MFTLFKRREVYWLRCSEGGREIRRSLRTRDLGIATGLILKREIATRLGNGFAAAARPYVPRKLKRGSVCRNHKDAVAYYGGFCKECYYDEKRKGTKLTEKRISDIKRAAFLKKIWRYDLEESDYVALLEKQKHRCALCSLPLGDDIYIDHEHASERVLVRGILHGSCNVGLGVLESNGAAWIEMALKYLGWIAS